MRSKSLSLLKVRLIKQLGINTFKYEKDMKKKRNKTLLTAVISLVVIIAMIYCGGTAYGLEKIGAREVIPIYALIFSSMLTLLFTILKVNGELFGFKDYEMLMSLPIKVSTIISSRFMSLYLWNTLFTIIIMLPMGSIYAIFEKPSISFYFMWFMSLFIATLIPTTIATIIGAVITAVAGKFRRTNIMTTVLSIIFMMGILVSPYFLQNTLNDQMSIADITNMGTKLADPLIKIYPIATIFQKAIIGNDMVSFILFGAISVAWYYVFVKLLSLKYKSINTKVSTYRMHSNFELRSLKKGSKVQALYKKELKRFFTSTIYLMNDGMGVVMAIVLTVAIALVGIDNIGRTIGYPEIGIVLKKSTSFIIAAVISMTCTTSVALSLEGKNVWIIKSLPLTPKQIYDSKILVNLTLNIPVSIICAFIMIIYLKLGVWSSTLMLLTPIAYSLFTAVWGIMIDNRLANYDWDTDTQVVKQSLSALFGIFGGMILAIIPAVLINVITTLDYKAFNSIIVVIIIVATYLLYKKEALRKIK